MTDLNPRPTLDLIRPSADTPKGTRLGLPGRPLTARTPGHEDELAVWRFLPASHHRCVGAWCRLDEWGPDTLDPQTPVVFGPHPHVGADVLTVVLEGELHHRDSLGNHIIVRPGTLLLMSAGDGMSHAQTTGRSAGLHALELWATTAGTRVEPQVQFREQSAILQLPGIVASVLVGELAGVKSPVVTHADVSAGLLQVEEGAGLSESTCWMPLRRAYEYALLLLDGDLWIDSEEVDLGVLTYLGNRLGGLDLRSRSGAHVLLVGGVRPEETHNLWWNMVTATTDEMVSARALWSAHAPRYGKVPVDAVRWPTPPMVGIPVRHPRPPVPPGRFDRPADDAPGTAPPS